LCKNYFGNRSIVDGVHQPKILNLNYDNAFSLNTEVLVYPAFDSENTTSLRLTASGTTGDITVTASDSFFKAEDAGRSIKLRNPTNNSVGWLTITNFSSDTSVSANVKETLPITNTDYWAWSVLPSSVIFYQGRLFYASKDRIIASRTQDDNGVPRFNDFTLGSDPTNALNLSNSIFRTPILWLRDNDKVLLAGTSSQILRVASLNTDGTLSPTNLPVITAVSTEGSKDITPLQQDNILFYASIVGNLNDKGSKLNSIVYDFMSDGYQVQNHSMLSGEINREGIGQMAYVRGRDNTLCCLKTNGEITCLLHDSRQELNGWYRLTTSFFDR
jgi:hypothetical protein